MGRAEKEDSRDRLEKERRQAAQEYRDVRKDPSWCVSMWVVEVDPEVSMSLQWVAGGDTDQAPCNLGWYACMYVYGQRMRVLSWAGWLPCLTRCLSISQDDMTPTRHGAVLC